jgi:hypothetical protein
MASVNRATRRMCWSRRLFSGRYLQRRKHSCLGLIPSHSRKKARKAPRQSSRPVVMLVTLIGPPTTGQQSDAAPYRTAWRHAKSKKKSPSGNNPNLCIWKRSFPTLRSLCKPRNSGLNGNPSPLRSIGR